MWMRQPRNSGHGEGNKEIFEETAQPEEHAEEWKEEDTADETAEEDTEPDQKHLKKRSSFPEKRDAADDAGTERKKASGSPERNFSL